MTWCIDSPIAEGSAARDVSVLTGDVIASCINHLCAADDTSGAIDDVLHALSGQESHTVRSLNKTAIFDAIFEGLTEDFETEHIYSENLQEPTLNIF